MNANTPPSGESAEDVDLEASRQEIRNSQLDIIKKKITPEKYQEFIENLNKLRDSIIGSASEMQKADLQRFLKTLPQLAHALTLMTDPAQSRSVDALLTKLRQAVQDLGFSKLTNPLSGAQERPQD